MSVEEIKSKIESLPAGGLTTKTINGKAYNYYQWSENGKQRSRIVKDDEIEILKTQIEQRKELQAQLRNMDLGNLSVAAKSVNFIPNLIRQIIYNMNDEDRCKSVFIQINSGNSLADLKNICVNLENKKSHIVELFLIGLCDIKKLIRRQKKWQNMFV